MSSQPKQKDMSEIVRSSAKRALGGGASGAAAMAIQVSSLMWLRTTMNYQYRFGTSTSEALKRLYKDGGVVRFYRGYLPALAQGPLSRFGDTAANAGVLAFMDSTPATANLPVSVKTAAASVTAGVWRIFLMPVDTLKTMMQVEGKQGMGKLGGKLRAGGPLVMFHGALAASAATMVGHFPWFFTYNWLDVNLPKAETTVQKLSRRAFMGFAASVVSDTVSNSVRVVKTTKQTFETSITYPQAIRHVVDKDGVAGLFGRGLQTRILANGLQGLLFSVLWRYFDDLFKSRGK